MRRKCGYISNSFSGSPIRVPPLSWTHFRQDTFFPVLDLRGRNPAEVRGHISKGELPLWAQQICPNPVCDADPLITRLSYIATHYTPRTVGSPHPVCIPKPYAPPETHRTQGTPTQQLGCLGHLPPFPAPPPPSRGLLIRPVHHNTSRHGGAWRALDPRIPNTSQRPLPPPESALSPLIRRSVFRRAALQPRPISLTAL